jgi:hypothetical protein
MTTENEGAEAPQATVFDLGRQKRKRVRQLRKGKGPLLEDIKLAVQEMKSTGVVPEDAHTVVVVVREKLPRNAWGF